MKYAAAFGIMCLALAVPNHGDSNPWVIDVYSPSYFECVHCESFLRQEQMLKRQYPGLTIRKHKLTQQEAKDLGVTAFPTLVVSQTIVGFGVDQRAALREIIE